MSGTARKMIRIWKDKETDTKGGLDDRKGDTENNQAGDKTAGK